MINASTDREHPARVAFVVYGADEKVFDLLQSHAPLVSFVQRGLIQMMNGSLLTSTDDIVRQSLRTETNRTGLFLPTENVERHFFIHSGVNLPATFFFSRNASWSFRLHMVVDALGIVFSIRNRSLFERFEAVKTALQHA